MPEQYTNQDVTYGVQETDAYVGELRRVKFRRRAARVAAQANADRIAPSLRYEVRKVGWFTYAVVALQNVLVPPGSVPDAGILPRRILNPVEDTIERDLGLPPTWRCGCGGKPFVGKECPRCGATQK